MVMPATAPQQLARILIARDPREGHYLFTGWIGRVAISTMDVLPVLAAVEYAEQLADMLRQLAAPDRSEVVTRGLPPGDPVATALRAEP